MYEICIKSMSVKRGQYMLMKLMKQFFFCVVNTWDRHRLYIYILLVCVCVCVCVCVYVYSVMSAHMPIHTQGT
jgi:hypothetical protein